MITKAPPTASLAPVKMLGRAAGRAIVDHRCHRLGPLAGGPSQKPPIATMAYLDDSPRPKMSSSSG